MTATLTFGHSEWNFAYRVALRVLKAPDQAEDAAQEALMNAYKARHAFSGRSKPASWLYRIAYRVALSHLQRPFPRRYSSADVCQAIENKRQAEPRHDSPEERAVAAQLAERLGDCLDGLSTKDRVAFTEKFLRGTSESELGKMLGVSANAAKQRAFRARRAVRAYMLRAGIS